MVVPQIRSAVDDGGATSYSVSPHTMNNVHTVSDVAVAACNANSPAGQADTFAHTLSDTAVPGDASNSSDRHAVRAWHTLSDVVVGTVLSY